MPKQKQKILIAMSGGVDSSVAAALLVEQGYSVTAAYMINYDKKVSNAERKFVQQSCCIPDYRDALRVSAKLGISLLKLNFQKEYKKHVLDYMFAEYKKGRTPNPDVYCNKYIKFGFWLEKMKELGFDKLATGHYAKIKILNKIQPSSRAQVEGDTHNKIQFSLMEAADKNKDQTYFLHQLNQEQLSQTLFPLGEYTKQEVRKLAKKFELPTENKAESMGICFIGEVPMKEFLSAEIKSKPGKIIKNSTKEILGDHDGLSFYTIGQRHGLHQLGGDKPLFVLEKNIKKNELVVGYEDDPILYKNKIKIEEMHWINGQPPKFPLKCTARLRHRQVFQDVSCKMIDGNYIFEFKKKQKAITPGQFIVLYKDGECLGGGVIT